eukprot:c17645_g1_i2.p1 GENE.c17645_g1_i2~~c17645_g1_i2.p1  ORF type:complete len:409 (-),score=160.33 c17645_g1_i2:573-1799(-)
MGRSMKVKPHKKKVAREMDHQLNEYLIKRVEDAAHGGLSEKPNKEIFALDTSRDVKTFRGVRDNQKTKSSDIISPQPTLFWESATQVSGGLPALSSTTIEPKPENRGSELVINHALALKKTGVLKKVLRQQQAKKKKRGTFSRTDDLWANPNQHKPPVKRKIGASPQVRGILSVQVAPEGLSYNPSFDAHQNVLAQAVAKEVKKDAEKDDYSRKIQKQLNMKVSISPEEQEESESDSGEVAGKEQEETAPVKKKRQPPRLTRAQKNKKRRVQLALRTAIRTKRKQKLQKQFNKIPTLLEDIEKVEETLEKQKQKRIRKLKRAQTKVPFRGKLKFEEDTGILDTPLTEDLSGQLRDMKVQGNLFRDRFKSLQRRGIIEPRKKAKPQKARWWQKAVNPTRGINLSSTTIL